MARINYQPLENCGRCGTARPDWRSEGQILERHRPHTDTVFREWLCDRCTAGMLTYLAGGKVVPMAERLTPHVSKADSNECLQ